MASGSITNFNWAFADGTEKFLVIFLIVINVALIGVIASSTYFYFDMWSLINNSSPDSDDADGGDDGGDVSGDNSGDSSNTQ